MPASWAASDRSDKNDGSEVTRLPRTGWMTEPATARVVAALLVAGGTPRFVGGCVRDTLLGRPITDIDIATPLPPTAVVAALETADIRAIPTGLDHGTVTALVTAGDGSRTAAQRVEITTLRVDVETDGRHAVVAFTDDWRADAARRDFTMNALSADPDGTLHDYFGGVADALAGRVRFVGDPSHRLQEDVLRLLRFFRFSAHYGRGVPDEAVLLACRSHAPGLGRLSGPRIRLELFKLLSAPDPSPVWRLMIDTAVAPVLLGWSGSIDRLAAMARSEPNPDPLRRLAALLDGWVEHAKALAERLRLSNEEKTRLTTLVDNSDLVTPEFTAHDVHRLAYTFGSSRAVDLILLAWAAAPEERRFELLLSEAAGWCPPCFPLKGRDALAAGVPAGRQLGTLLSRVENWWIESGFSADRNECLEQLIRYWKDENSKISH